MLVIHTIKLHFMIINASDVLHWQTANIYYFAEYHDHLKGDRKKNVYLKSILKLPPCILN